MKNPQRLLMFVSTAVMTLAPAAESLPLNATQGGGRSIASPRRRGPIRRDLVLSSGEHASVTDYASQLGHPEQDRIDYKLAIDTIAEELGHVSRALFNNAMAIQSFALDARQSGGAIVHSVTQLPEWLQPDWFTVTSKRRPQEKSIATDVLGGLPELQTTDHLLYGRAQGGRLRLGRGMTVGHAGSHADLQSINWQVAKNEVKLWGVGYSVDKQTIGCVTSAQVSRRAVRLWLDACQDQSLC